MNFRFFCTINYESYNKMTMDKLNYIQFTLVCILLSIFAITHNCELALAALIVGVPPIMHLIFHSIFVKINKTSLIHSDIIYSATQLWRQFSQMASSLILFAFGHYIHEQLFVQRLLTIHMAWTLIALVQKALLFLISYNTIWVSYAEKIRESVITYQIFDRFIDYVKLKVPHFKIKKKERKTSSIYQDAVTGSFEPKNQDIEAPLLAQSSTLQTILVFTSPRVPLSIVHEAISDIEFDRNDGVLLYKKVMQAINVDETHSQLTAKALQLIFTETDMWNIAKIVLGSHPVITEQQFIAAFGDAVTQRSNLHVNLENYQSMINTLDRVLLSICAVIMLFVTMFIFKLPVLKNGPLIISIFLALSIMFGSTLTRFFEGLVFVFLIRPFNVGDTVFIKDEASREYCHTVSSMHLLTTVFVREDGQTVIMSNFRLKDLIIINAYRSAASKINMTVLLPPLTMQELIALESAIGCEIIITSFEELSCLATVTICHHTNLQNIQSIASETRRIRRLIWEFVTPKNMIKRTSEKVV